MACFRRGGNRVRDARHRTMVTSALALLGVLAMLFATTTTIIWPGPEGVHGFVPNNRVHHHSVPKKTFPALFLKQDDQDFESEARKPQIFQHSRERFLRLLPACGAAALATVASQPSIPPARAFDGGVGGLGKTKPETGVELFNELSAPIQDEKGVVSSEIKGTDGSPILVSFASPWPLLPTSGALEARDIRSTESAFVQVTGSKNHPKWEDKKGFQALLMESVFASTGKFGAYGQPFDVQVKPVPNASEGGASLFAVTFTTLTPAMRESERKALVAAQAVGSTLVLLVVTTTSARYAANAKTIASVAESFEAIAAPQTSLKNQSS